MTDLISQASAYFEGVVGAQNVRRTPEDLQHLGKDWTKEFEPCPAVVVLPRTRQEVQQVVAYCHRERLPYVPSGGRTGWSAGRLRSRVKSSFLLGA